jgi:hypothetical protein
MQQRSQTVARSTQITSTAMLDTHDLREQARSMRVEAGSERVDLELERTAEADARCSDPACRRHLIGRSPRRTIQRLRQGGARTSSGGDHPQRIRKREIARDRMHPTNEHALHELVGTRPDVTDV